MRPLKFGVRLWARKETPRWVRWHTLVIPGPGNPRLKTVSSRPAWATRWGSVVTKEKEEICSPGALCLLSKITGGQSHQTELVTGAMASGYLRSTGPLGSPPAPHLNTSGSIPCLCCLCYLLYRGLPSGSLNLIGQVARHPQAPVASRAWLPGLGMKLWKLLRKRTVYQGLLLKNFAQLVECLPSMHGALSSFPSVQKPIHTCAVTYTCHLNT